MTGGGGGGVNEVDKRAEPWGKTGSREPGSVSESHGARAPAQTEQDGVAAGPPAPPPGTRRERTEVWPRLGSVLLLFSEHLSAPSQTCDALRG